MRYWKNYLRRGFSTGTVIGSTFIVALILNMLPVPHQVKLLMPDWLVLVLIYWIMFVPGVIGLNFTFLLGVIIDLLAGNILGTTSLCLVPVAFLAECLRYLFKMFNIWQQFFIILILVGTSQLIKLWIQLYIHHPINSKLYWLVIISSTVMWPLVCVVLHLFRKVVKFW